MSNNPSTLLASSRRYDPNFDWIDAAIISGAVIVDVATPEDPGVETAVGLDIVAGREATAASEQVSAANRAAFEAYKDQLRAQMERPAVSDSKLSAILNRVYRPNATVGSGSIAAAVRFELETGNSVGGVFHSQKAAEEVQNLAGWIERNPTATSGDRAAAENVLRDLQNSLSGRP